MESNETIGNYLTKILELCKNHAVKINVYYDDYPCYYKIRLDRNGYHKIRAFSALEIKALQFAYFNMIKCLYEDIRQFIKESGGILRDMEL